MTPAFAERMARVTPSAIMELVKIAGSGHYLSFASGLPDPALFPADALRTAADAVLTEDAAGALQYGPAEGYLPLRDWVAERLRQRGFAANAENVLLTSGSQQALDLAARAYLDPEDAVCVESPTYLAALHAFDSCGARYLPVPHDPEGMDVEAAERALRSGAKMLFALPNFQNPTGRTLSRERRERLADCLSRTSTLLVEDDAYYDLRYEGDPLPPIGSLLPPESVLYTSTFSKSIAPGLRVGFIYGAASVISRLAQLKQITDLHTGSLTQRIVYRYVIGGELDPQIARLCAAYRGKRDAMLAALETSMPQGVTWTRPAGGMFLWVTLPETLDSAELLKTAMERKLIYVPGAGFHPDGRGANTLRLNFVSAPLEKIESGIRLLADILRASE